MMNLSVNQPQKHSYSFRRTTTDSLFLDTRVLFPLPHKLIG